MRKIVFSFLLLLCPFLASQSKEARSVRGPAQQPRIFLRTNDVDCDSGRFKTRLARELRRNGATLVDAADIADIIVSAAVIFGSRPLQLKSTSVDVTIKARGGAPFTTTTQWRSAADSADGQEIAKTVRQNISDYGSPAKTVHLESGEGVDAAAIREELKKNGYRLVEAEAELTVQVVVKAKPVDDEEDFATVRYEIRDRRTGLPYAQDIITKSDPHTYAEPLDVLASSAIEVAKRVPAKRR